ncbi:hypothetical protein B0H13DRAFT_635986 [Mycena leptocephala]|nr:hypothetical protein B0H13DRAFT_635986 [Mycena leptocephala]
MKQHQRSMMLGSFAVVCAADANAALLVARRCPAACAINCPDVGDAALSIYSHSLRRRADIHARSSAAPTSTAPTSAVKSYWCGMQRRSGMWMGGGGGRERLTHSGITDDTKYWFDCRSKSKIPAPRTQWLARGRCSPVLFSRSWRDISSSEMAHVPRTIHRASSIRIRQTSMRSLRFVQTSFRAISSAESMFFSD